VLALLEPVRRAGGLVLEIGAGTGALTRHLTDAGHRVIATDASPAMLARCKDVPGIEAVRHLALPDDPVPECDAIVGVGHTLNYLPDVPAVHRALIAMADALRPGGLLVIDVCDLAWGRARAGAPDTAQVAENWALITRFPLPRPDCYVRELTTFVKTADGGWRRDDERHDNVLLDTAQLPPLLAQHGVRAHIREAFGEENLPVGLVALIGHRAVTAGPP
jgi:SAM-dependent methyltransferase